MALKSAVSVMALLVESCLREVGESDSTDFEFVLLAQKSDRHLLTEMRVALYKDCHQFLLIQKFSRIELDAQVGIDR